MKKARLILLLQQWKLKVSMVYWAFPEKFRTPRPRLRTIEFLKFQGVVRILMEFQWVEEKIRENSKGW